ncbi:MAG: hypothetical protein GKR94_27980 [Gammaproteobacteria bacterium]|nr:hypothetical protein [Gammaproteobacteria bacterium]
MVYRQRSGYGKSSLLKSGRKKFIAGRKKKNNKEKSLETRVSDSGYRQFRDNKTGNWVYTHRRVAEKKIGGKIYADREVHHIDGNKNNNKSSNLRVVSKAQHRLIHKKKA